jgi:hypothetical protein
VTDLIERLRAKIEAIPPRDRDWYAVTSPWLGKDQETWIISGSPDPHKGLAVCDFQDVSFAGVEDQFTDEEWTGHNWAMAEFIETADPNAILSLLKEIAELREALKPFAEAHKQLEHMPSNAKPEHGLLSSDRRLFSKAQLAPARAKLEGSGA